MFNEDRFEAGAGAYAAYLKTVEGRLRLDLAWEYLRAFISYEAATAAARIAGELRPRALDLGGGTGALALRLATQGFDVTLAEPSAAMLSIARDAARQAGVFAQISFQQMDAAGAARQYGPQWFALAACHNVLEYVPDVAEVVRLLGWLLKEGGLVSILVRQRAGEVMRAALKTHDLTAAEAALSAEWVTESLYGGPARTFADGELRALLAQYGFESVAERGIRVVADYLPASLCETEEAYMNVYNFELELGARPEFAGVARYRQVIARRKG